MSPLEREFHTNQRRARAALRKLTRLVHGARNKEAIMAQIDELTAAVSNLEAAASAAVSEIKALQSSDDEAALASLTSRVSAVASNLTAAVPAPAPAAEPEAPAPEQTAS